MHILELVLIWNIFDMYSIDGSAVAEAATAVFAAATICE
jgi:hypothetical protein